MPICKFCSREIQNKGSFTAHEMSCKLNPDRIQHKRGIGSGAKKGCIPWNTGLTKESDARVAANGTRIRELYKSGKIQHHRTKHSEETKAKMSKSRQALYMSGWESTAGRCKKYKYVSKIGDTITVDGTWELKVAQYLDSISVKWERNKQRFKYIKPNGDQSTYQPDFYVYDWDSYIEIKGYQTDIDIAKWTQFEHSLLIWKKKIIGSIENGRLIDLESTLFAKQLEPETA